MVSTFDDNSIIKIRHIRFLIQVKIEPKSFIQPSKVLPVELTEIHPKNHGLMYKKIVIDKICTIGMLNFLQNQCLLQKLQRVFGLMKTELYNSIFITKNSKNAGPTKTRLVWIDFVGFFFKITKSFKQFYQLARF